MMHAFLKATTVLSLFAGLTACSSTRLVKPIEAKKFALGADFGGPIIDFAGAKIPIPFTSITGAYGVDSSTSVYASVHTTALAAGVVQLEIGCLRDVLRPKASGFGVSVLPAAHLMISTWDGKTRFYPELDINAHWAYSKKKPHFAYFSIPTWFDLNGTQAHGRTNKEHILPSFCLGHTFVTKKMRYALELKWIAPFSSNRDMVVGYNGIANQGTLGAYFSVYRTF